MTAAFAQSGAVKGKVLDELGEPIIGANIVEKGTTNGTITDIDGNYTLSVNDLKKAILQVSFIGYNSVEEAVKGRSAVDVKLGASVVNLGTTSYITGTRRNSQTRYLTLQQVGRVTIHSFIKIFLGNVRYGTGNLPTSLRTITDSYNLSQIDRKSVV